MPVNKSHKSEILHALGNLGVILKTHCSLVMRTQCLMLNLAKTQRFAGDKRSSSQLFAHALPVPLLCCVNMDITVFCKNKRKIRLIWWFALSQNIVFKGLPAVCVYHLNHFHFFFSRLALIHTWLISLFHHLLLRFFLNHSGCWVCWSVLLHCVCV